MSNITINGLTPFSLSVSNTISSNGPLYEAQETFLNQTFIEPLFQPGATILEDGNPVDKSTVKNAIYATLGSHIQPKAEASLKPLYEKALLTYKPELAFKDIFVVQAATKEQLPTPSNTVVYTPNTDVIPTSKNFLAGLCDFDAWFATMGYYLQADVLGVAMKNQQTFDAFTEFLTQKLTANKTVLPKATIDMVQSLQKENLSKLTLGITIRTDANPNDNDYDFARVIQEWSQEFTEINQDAYLCPFSLPQLMRPNHLIFFNIEAHAYSDASQIYKNCADIRNDIKYLPMVLSSKRINKLGEQREQLEKLVKGNGQKFRSGPNIYSLATRIALSKSRLSCAQIYKRVVRILHKLGQVQISQNPQKFKTVSYIRPNRRDPDNYNLCGTKMSIRYLPDIHLYIDTSGSITEAMFANSVKSAILLGKKLNINIYVNFFSTALTQPYMLRLNGKTAAQAYAQFRTFPKVTGGTDFECVWNYINLSPKRKRELSLMITDFGYEAPSTWCTHPKNLYYIPCENKDWDIIRQYAIEFIESAIHIDPLMRAKLLF